MTARSQLALSHHAGGRGFLQGSHAELGDMFVAWAPDARHVEPGVRSSRFGAWLAPFPGREEAERALIEAGAVLEQGASLR